MTRETLFEVIRFGFSGGVALVTQLGFLYTFANIFGFWYLISAIIAHIVSIVVNFLLQKLYVRKNYTSNSIDRQVYSFTLLAVSYLLVNAGLMYLLVSVFLWPHLLAQGVLVLLLSVLTFGINKYFIFR